MIKIIFKRMKVNSGIFEAWNLISEIGILKNLFKDGILEIDK